MKLLPSGLISILLLVTSIGCQKREIPPTDGPVTISPRPTLPIGVDFVTVTPAAATAVLAPAPERTASAPPTETATVTPVLYTIEAGDTLFGIAVAQGISLDELLSLNPSIRPELLTIGQQIILPPRLEAELPSLPATEAPISIEIAGLGVYSSVSGGTWVLGEVVNNGPQPVELVQVEVGLRSPENETIASDILWVTPVTIPSMARAPFGILFPDVGTSEAAADVEVVGGRQAHELGNRYLDLAVVDAEVTIGPNPIRVSGRITNQGRYPASQISIVTTFYDDQGLVMGFHELVLDDNIAPGESWPFSLVGLPPGGRADGVEFAVHAVVAE